MSRDLATFIRHSNSRLAVLTGAGVSTDSGVPDYRGPRGIYKQRSDYKPITYQQFMSSESFRRRYWARSYLGWPRISHALPNETHATLSRLQMSGHIQSLMTQNVDGLHTASGSQNILELHGSLHYIQCQGCGHISKRTQMQDRLTRLNPIVHEWAQRYPDAFKGDVASSSNPDGDVDISWNYSDFAVPSCDLCGSVLKPGYAF